MSETSPDNHYDLSDIADEIEVYDDSELAEYLDYEFISEQDLLEKFEREGRL